MVERARDDLDGEPPHAVDDQTGEAVLAAWRSLSSDSRALLWRLVMHDEGSHRLVPGGGTTGQGPHDPGDRARERLRLGLLSELVARAEEPDCASIRRTLGAHLRGSPPGRDRPEVDEHLAWCAPCRAAASVLDDVDGAIRQRVAPALLPGAFATDGRPGGAAAGVAAGATDPLALFDRVAVEAADAKDPTAPLAARVLSVPGRGALLVTAAAALALAMTLFLLESSPDGTLTAEAPAPRGQPVTSGSGAAAPGPAGTGRGASGASGLGPVIGVAVAEDVSGDREAGRVPAGRSRPDTGLSVRAVPGPARTSALAAAPSTPRTSSAAGRPPTSARPPALPGPTAPPPPAVAPTPVTPPTPPVVAPPGGVVVTTLTFEPADRGTFLARLSVSPGWLVSSVVDEAGHRAVEHVATPSALFEERMHAGRVVVEVTRVTDAARTGALVATFVGRADSVLPGSGTYTLR